MSLEKADIEFYIDRPFWTPAEHSSSELLDSVSGGLDPMDLDSLLFEEDPVGKYIEDEQNNPDSVSALSALPDWSENSGAFNELSVEYPIALQQTTIGSAGPVSLVSPQEPPALSEETVQTSLHDLIPVESTNVSQTLQPQRLHDVFSPSLQPVPQSTHEISRENIFEAVADLQTERAAQEQYLLQPRQKWNYGNDPHFTSNMSVQGNPFELQGDVVTSLYEPQAFARTTPDSEMHLHESSEDIHTPSEIDGLSSSQQLARCNTADWAQQASANIQVLKSYNHECFCYFEVWISNPAVCPCCDKTYANIAYLSEHIKRSHKNKYQQRIRCPQCNLMVMNETNLLRHIKNVHRKDEIVDICEICNAKFSSFSSASSHRRNVHGIQAAKSRQVSEKKKNIFFQCKTCGSYAKEKGNMIRHVNVVHLQRRTFRCECGIAFKTKHNLDCHMVSKNCFRMKA